MTRVAVGSQNEIKLAAVTELKNQYSTLADAKVIGKPVSSGVAEQPLSLRSTLQGAQNRAEAAFVDVDYSVGLEGGIISVSTASKIEHMQICAAVLFDGNRHTFGLSSAFELPQQVMRFVLEEKLDLSQALIEAGYTRNTNIGKAEGAVGIFTGGRLVRKEYLKQALQMAFTGLE